MNIRTACSVIILVFSLLLRTFGDPVAETPLVAVAAAALHPPVLNQASMTTFDAVFEMIKTAAQPESATKQLQ